MKGYFRTLQQPTAVQALCAANLAQRTLVVVSGTHMKQYVRTSNSLTQVRSQSLFGSLLYIASYTTQAGHHDALLVLAEPHFAGFLQVTDTGLATLAQAELPHRYRTKVPQPRFDFAQDRGLLVAHLHSERILVISVTLQSVAPDILRVHEHHLVDHCVRELCLLTGPQLAVISETGRDSFLSVFDFNAEVQQTLKHWKGAYFCSIRRAESGLWVAFTGKEITIISRDNQLLETVVCPFEALTAVGQFEADMLLVATEDNRLAAIALSSGLAPTILLEGVRANHIIRLDSEYVFLGSYEGSSQLCRLPIAGSSAALTWELSSLAPIVSLQVYAQADGSCNILTANRTDRGSLVCSCKWGSKVTLEAQVEVGRAVGLWTLQDCPAAGQCLLVLSFVDQTRTIALLGEDLEEVQLGGFDYSRPTVLSEKWTDSVVQVTKSEVRCISDWACSAAITIPSDILLSCVSSGRVYVFSASLTLRVLSLPSLQSIGTLQLDCEISSIACTHSHLALASFEGRFILFAHPLSLEVVAKEEIGIDSPPRCLLFTTFGSQNLYLLCGLGDGYLLTYSLSSHEVTKTSLLYVGNFISSAVPFHCNEKHCVLLVSDRSMAVFMRQGVMRQAYIGAEDIRLAASFSNPIISTGLITVSKAGLNIASVTDIVDMEMVVEEREMDKVRLMTVADGQLYLVTCRGGVYSLRVFTLPHYTSPWEHVLRGSVEPVCMQPVAGRLLLCCSQEHRASVLLLQPYSSKAPRIHPFQQPPVAAAKLSSENVIIAFQQALTVWTVSRAGKLELQSCFQYPGSVIGCIDVEYNLIAVADLFRGVGIYIYTPEGFEQVGQTQPLMDVVSVKLHSPIELLVADETRNLIVLGLVDSEEGKKLRVLGGTHLGDMVTCMHSLPSPHPDSPLNTALTSVLGAVYIYKTIGEQEASALLPMAEYLGNSEVAFFKYQEFRFPEVRVICPETLVDGDLLLRFLDYPKSQQLEIAKSISAHLSTELSVEEVQILITKLAYSY